MFLRRGRIIRSSYRTRERRKTFLFRLFFLPVALTALVALGAFLAHRPEVIIRDISVQGTLALAEDDIRRVVHEEISGAYLRFFPRANSLLYPRKEIEERLKNTFPLLSSVTVRFKNFHSIVVVVEERKPAHLWCGEELLARKGVPPECFFLDSDGVVFARAPLFSTGVYLSLYGPIAGGTVREGNVHETPLGFYFLTTQDFHFLVAFAGAMKELGAVPEKIFVMGDGDYNVILANGVSLLINQKHGLDSLVGNLEAALQTDKLTTEDVVGERSRLEYIDVRFKNKVLYKFK